MSVFKGEHLYKVLTKLLPDDPELRARVIAKPGNFKVHTSHFAPNDLEKRKGRLCPKPGAMPVPISHAERWVEPSSHGGSQSSQAPRSTGSRPPAAPSAAPRSGAPLVDSSNRLRSPAVGSARPAAPIPLFASPASQQPEKRVRLGLAGARSHAVNQVRAALAAPFKPPVDASSSLASQVGGQSSTSTRRSARIASSPSWQVGGEAPGGVIGRSPVPRTPMTGNNTPRASYLERASVSLSPAPLPSSGSGRSPGTSATPRRGPANHGTPRTSGRGGGENLMEKFYQQKIKQLEEELARKEDVGNSKAARLAQQVQALTNKQLILEEQLRILRWDKEASVELIRLLEKEVDEQTEELEHLIRTTQDKLTWENVIQEDSPWSSCISEITGLPSCEVLQCMFAWLNWDGIADRLRYWNGAATISRMEAEASEEGPKRASAGKPSSRSFTSENAFLATLVKLKTGLGTKLVSKLTGIHHANLSRIFTTWIAYMNEFFNAEFPVPTVAQMKGRISKEWEAAYGTEAIRFILDCTEYRIQQPSSRKAARTCYSDYKGGHTAKLLAGILPTGAYCGTSQAYPGKISDTEIVSVSHWLDILERGDCVASDKGFDQCAPQFQARGARVVAPSRRMPGRKVYTPNERQNNEEQSNLRIHVERHFARVQTYRVFANKKICLYSVDMIEKTFNVISHLCNLQAPLVQPDHIIASEEEAPEADI